jgi:Putative transposase
MHKGARTDLCGGRGVTRVPTATRGLHLAGAGQRDCFPEQGDGLCHPVPLRGGDAHHHRGRPQASRCPTRRDRQLRRTDWVVYANPPFGGPERVLAYLGRYTHRVAIANSRLISLVDGKVSFPWKNYRQNRKAKVMTLDADEFMRRFLLHTLPDGFHRIRHYGFLANGGRNDRLALCRQTFAPNGRVAIHGEGKSLKLGLVFARQNYAPCSVRHRLTSPTSMSNKSRQRPTV